MNKINSFSISGFLLIMLLFSCNKGGSEPVPDPVEPDLVLPKVTVSINKSTSYQTIEGFGFFGAADFWWSSAGNMWNDSWEKTGDKPGAFNLAMDIHSGLYYGNMSAWVWWQGSQSTMNEFNLMSGTSTSKKYSVSKQYYRYIRPGAVHIKSTTDDPDFFVTAYVNSAKATNTIVIINSVTADKAVTLAGGDLPATYKMYRTNATTENCSFIKEVGSGTAASFAVQAKSILTLQAGVMRCKQAFNKQSSKCF